MDGIFGLGGVRTLGLLWLCVQAVVGDVGNFLSLQLVFMAASRTPQGEKDGDGELLSPLKVDQAQVMKHLQRI